MKHKKLLLVTFILTLSVVQQAQVGAETLPKTPIPFLLNAPPYSPPDKVSVTYFPLKTDGSREDDGHGNLLPKCDVKKNNNSGDTQYGCTEKITPPPLGITHTLGTLTAIQYKLTISRTS